MKKLAGLLSGLTIAAGVKQGFLVSLLAFFVDGVPWREELAVWIIIASAIPAIFWDRWTQLVLTAALTAVGLFLLNPTVFVLERNVGLWIFIPAVGAAIGGCIKHSRSP